MMKIGIIGFSIITFFPFFLVEAMAKPKDLHMSNSQFIQIIKKTSDTLPESKNGKGLLNLKDPPTLGQIYYHTQTPKEPRPPEAEIWNPPTLKGVCRDEFIFVRGYCIKKQSSGQKEEERKI
ncbi:MAG: hypothetical protein R3B95_17380 [Nitrospirales bacterium]|nr:hypothetical protein [Nitrospirales bacterium]